MEEILNRLSVQELRSLARALDLRGRSSMSKADLVHSVAAGLKATEGRHGNLPTKGDPIGHDAR